MIWLPLAGWRRREPAGKTLSQGGDSRSGVLGVTLPPQGIIPEGSPYSRELSLRMHLAAALILDGRERWVRQADQALAASSGSSFRPISTSNGGGSRLASSRGPWTSAELASRPVRRGRSKPKENALDSRKVGGHAIKIPAARERGGRAPDARARCGQGPRTRTVRMYIPLHGS